MRTLLALCAAALGSLAVLNASTVPCPVNTIAFYEANFTTAANGCTVGPLVFYDFTFAGAATGPAVSLSDAQATLSPISDINGFGLVFAPTIPWTASPTGRTDVQLAFIATAPSNIIASLFKQETGTATGAGGSDVLTETFCPGGTTLPPAGNPFCPGGNQVTFLTLANSSNPTSTSATSTFPSFSSIAVDKDIDVRGISPDGNTTGNAQILSVRDQFGTVPEPSTLSLLAIGLVPLLLRRWCRART